MNKEVPLYKVRMSPQAIVQLQTTLSSGYIGCGPKVKEFETKLEEFLGTSRLLTTNSCTSALHLALHLIKGPRAEGSLAEVIAPPNTCIAVASAIFHNGYNIRWCDIDQYTYNICLTQIQKHLNDNTLAVVVPHFCGMPVELNKLYNILRRHYNITGKVVWVIEDCANAFGSTYKNDLIGAHHLDLDLPHENTIKCFSFQAIKTLTTGDGGAIVLPSDDLYEEAKKLRWYGLDRSKSRYGQNIKSLGFKFHMNDIVATIGLANLEEVSQAIEKQKENRLFYHNQLKHLQRTSIYYHDRVSASGVFPILADDVDCFSRYMVENGVEVNYPHDNLIVHSCLPKATENDLVVLKQHRNMVCLPAGWWVDEEDREHIVQLVKDWYG